MTAPDLLALLPEFRSLTAEAILAHPAWSASSVWPAEGSVLRAAAVRPADTLSLRIRFEDDEHVLSIADSPLFPDLHRLWAARADIPEPLLLALVEKEAGPLLQLLENLARRQITLSGLADPATAAPDGSAFSLSASSGESLDFVLTLTPALAHSLGELRRLDPAHASVADLPIPGRIELASFTLGAAERAALTAGDRLLVPELAASKPRFVADVLASAEPDLVRVVASEPAYRPFSAVVAPDDETPEEPAPETLLLLYGAALLAEVRAAPLGEQPALEILTALPQGA